MTMKTQKEKQHLVWEKRVFLDSVIRNTSLSVTEPTSDSDDDGEDES